jgi:hypothetical protein
LKRLAAAQEPALVPVGQLVAQGLGADDEVIESAARVYEEPVNALCRLRPPTPPQVAADLRAPGLYADVKGCYLISASEENPTTFAVQVQSDISKDWLIGRWTPWHASMIQQHRFPRTPLVGAPEVRP